MGDESNRPDRRQHRAGESPPTAPEAIRDIAALRAAVGTTLGHSPWLTIAQERVDRFAAATGDEQYIHIDPQRAATLFGGTIAHGFLTLSLIPLLSAGLDGATIALGARMTINYGLNRVRFIAPVRVGARVRLRADLLAVEEIGAAAVQATQRCTIEIEGESRPACVAETILRYVF
jgi:acyl dehydratase